MSEYIVKGAEPNETVLHTRTPNGYEEWRWLPVREEVVRCRDCMHFAEGHQSGVVWGGRTPDWCVLRDYPTKGDGFCHRGIRRVEQ